MVGLAIRGLMALAVVCVLAAGVAGGLLRADALPAWLQQIPWVGQAALEHAALMLSAFLGTVIGVERAVALKQRWAFVAPVASAFGGVALLTGHAPAGAWLGLLASGLFVAVNFIFLLRQPQAHIALLLAGAMALGFGNALFAMDLHSARALLWWFAFIVLTITAERLEMYRLKRRHALAYPLLFAVLACLVVGATVSPIHPATGGVVYGSALMALAAWLVVFDIARQTVLAHGLSRYMALCLLMGYAWLAVAGLAWIGMALGCPGRDMALHALGLGFIVSMVMGHAPVIMPAIAGVRLLFGNWFYVPLGLLHASLLLRLFGGMVDTTQRAWGATLNAVTLLGFVVTVAASAVAWHRHNAQRVAFTND